MSTPLESMDGAVRREKDIEPATALAHALMAAVRNVAAAIAGDPHQSMPAIREQARRLLQADDARVHLVDVAGDATLVLRHAEAPPGLPADLPHWSHRYTPSNFLRQAIDSFLPTLIARADSDQARAIAIEAGCPSAQTYLIVPLRADQVLQGVLFLLWNTETIVSPLDMSVIDVFGHSAAIAIRSDHIHAAERAARHQVESLIAATRLVLDTQGQDLDATLDLLVERAGVIFGADEVHIELLDVSTDEIIHRRASALAIPASIVAQAAGRYPLIAVVREALATRRTVIIQNAHDDPRIEEFVRIILPTVRSGMVVPLFADDKAVGVMYIYFQRPHQIRSHDPAIAESLAHHGAIVIRDAHDLAETRREKLALAETRDELSAIVEAIDNSIIVYNTDGTIRMLNDSARARFLERWDRVPTCLDDFPDVPGVNVGLTSRPPKYAVLAALQGQADTDVVDFQLLSGETRRFLIHAAPLFDGQGTLIAAVVVSRDITGLVETITTNARLDGAIKTARLVDHRLSQKLAHLVQKADALSAALPDCDQEMIKAVTNGASDAARIVRQLATIIRFEEVSLGGTPPMLDLEASIKRTRPTPGNTSQMGVDITVYRN